MTEQTFAGLIIILWLLFSFLIAFAVEGIYKAIAKAVNKHKEKKRFQRYHEEIVEKKRKDEYFKRYLLETKDM